MGLIKALGAANIALGVVSICFYIILLGIKIPLHDTGCGIWSGALLILAGGMGIYAAKAKHRMAYSFTLLCAIIGLIADIAALALAIYVFYYLTQIYPDNQENMPIYQVYLGFHSLWFLTVLVSFFSALLLVKTAWSEMPDSRQKDEVFVEPPRVAQPPAQYHHPGGYQPTAPRPYYY